MRAKLKYIFTPLFFVIAIPVVLFHDLLWPQIASLFNWLTRYQVVSKIEAWVARQPAWMIVVLFFAPQLVLEPINIWAGYLLFQPGSMWLGIMILAISKIVGNGLAARLLYLAKDKLLSYRAIRWIWDLIMGIRDRVYSLFESIPGYNQARAMIRWISSSIRAIRMRRGFITTRFLAILRKLKKREPNVKDS